MGQMLTSKRRKNLNSFVEHTGRTLQALMDEAHTAKMRHSFEKVYYALYSYPTVFFPRRHLVARATPRGNHVVYSFTEGQNVRTSWTDSKGIMHERNMIQLPNIFGNGKLTFHGAFTFRHEYTHAGVDHYLTADIARVSGMPYHKAEEVRADLMPTAMFSREGVSQRVLIENLRGRMGVYGPRHFRWMLSRVEHISRVNKEHYLGARFRPPPRHVGRPSAVDIFLRHLLEPSPPTFGREPWKLPLARPFPRRFRF